MKKLICVILIILCAAFAGCSAFVRTNILDSESPSLDENSQFSANEAAYGWVMNVTDTSLLLCTEDNGLFWVSAKDIPLTDENGTNIDIGNISCADTVEVVYDGGIMETYPAMFSGVSGIRITGHRSSLITFYNDVLDRIYETDSEINENTGMMAFDIAGLTNMSDAEKTAFVYLAGEKYGKEAFVSTYGDLKDHGYLTKDGGKYTDGLLITITVTDTGMDDGFEFHISKWRSVDESVGFSECIAKKSTESWSYDIGTIWHS